MVVSIPSYSTTDRLIKRGEIIIMAKIDFGGTEEEVVTRDEFPLEKAREVLKDEVVAVPPSRSAASPRSSPTTCWNA
jgi:hypothetical protein